MPDLRIPGIARWAVVGPADRAWRLSRAAERAARARVVEHRARATLACIDAALASPYADQAVQRVIDSRLAECAVERALSGRLVDVVASDLVEYRVVERVVDKLLFRDAVDRALDQLEQAGVADQVIDRLLAGGAVERLTSRLLEGPELEHIVDGALDSPGAERLVAHVLESRMVEDASARVVDDVLGRLRASEALWTLIDEVAQSPAVADAIAQQGAGFADQVGDELRDRSRHADEQLERAVWRVFRRRPVGSGGTPTTTGAA
jgi:uncharacterized membrane-anchored protein YjiN (DUF445 family)